MTKTRWILGALLSFTYTLHAQTMPPLWRISGATPQLYSMGLSPDAAFEGHHGVAIRSIAAADPKTDFGTIIQAATAAPWRGKRVAMRAWIRTEEADSAQMWLRIDSTEGSIYMDNMDKRPIVGTTGWWRYSIVMDVPQEAAYLVYGVFLVGGGYVAVDSIEFEAVPESVPLTKKIYKEGQLHLPKDFVPTPPRVVLDMPSNLDFEQPLAP